LESKGAKRIICFFDENSGDERMSVITNEGTQRVHKFFLDKLLEDESLGLILKPGYPNTFYSRIGVGGDLLEKAKETGRCVVLDKGSNLKTDQYPAEAAQAADLCVGLLLSGTVALESYLCGTPTVFLDLEKLYSNPVYSWGRGSIVFDDLEELYAAAQRFLRTHEKSTADGFGDLSRWAEGKDRFRDGKAAMRMGQYICWLIESFDAGASRDEAMQYANQRYTEAWGPENVVRWQ
jgi:hypothetical protein